MDTTLTGHVSTEIVKEWGKAFDIDALIEEEKKDLAGEAVTLVVPTVAVLLALIM